MLSSIFLMIHHTGNRCERDAIIKSNKLFNEIKEVIQNIIIFKMIYEKGTSTSGEEAVCVGVETLRTSLSRANRPTLGAYRQYH